MKILKRLAVYFLIATVAMLSACNYAYFIFPNRFAPAGLDGVCTMIQDLTEVSIGYLSLLVNLPLIALAFFLLNKDFALKSAVYVFSFSLCSILLREWMPSDFGYLTANGTSAVFAPIAAGAIRGVLYALTLRLNASSGGTDFIAALVKRKKPHLELMSVIFIINLSVSLCSFFVYGMKAEPVICSILYSFITSSVSRRLRARGEGSVKYEVITQDAAALCERIVKDLGKSATVLDARGAYSGTDKKMVVCIADRREAPFLEEMILSFSSPVVFKTAVDSRLVGIDYK